MLEKIYPHVFMQLSKEYRDHIATIFGVKQSAITEVRDQTVISDGRTTEDLAVINAETMEAYVGSKETFARLWELTIAKAKSELYPAISLDTIADEAPVVEEPIINVTEQKNDTKKSK